MPGFCGGGAEGAWELALEAAIRTRMQHAKLPMRKRRNPLNGYGRSVSHRGDGFRIAGGRDPAAYGKISNVERRI